MLLAKKTFLKTFDGFSLIEMLIVVAIVGVLAAVGIPQYQQHIKNQKILHAKLDLGIISAAAEDNYITYGSFAIPNMGSARISGASLITSRILLDEVSLATPNSRAPYTFIFQPNGNGFYVTAVPDVNFCSGCPNLRIDRGSSVIAFY